MDFLKFTLLISLIINVRSEYYDDNYDGYSIRGRKSNINNYPSYPDYIPNKTNYKDEYGTSQYRGESYEADDYKNDYESDDYGKAKYNQDENHDSKIYGNGNQRVIYGSSIYNSEYTDHYDDKEYNRYSPGSVPKKYSQNNGYDYSPKSYKRPNYKNHSNHRHQDKYGHYTSNYSSNYDKPSSYPTDKFNSAYRYKDHYDDKEYNRYSPGSVPKKYGQNNGYDYSPKSYKRPNYKNHSSHRHQDKYGHYTSNYSSNYDKPSSYPTDRYSYPPANPLKHNKYGANIILGNKHGAVILVKFTIKGCSKYHHDYTYKNMAKMFNKAELKQKSSGMEFESQIEIKKEDMKKLEKGEEIDKKQLGDIKETSGNGASKSRTKKFCHLRKKRMVLIVQLPGTAEELRGIHIVSIKITNKGKDANQHQIFKKNLKICNKSSKYSYGKKMTYVYKNGHDYNYRGNDDGLYDAYNQGKNDGDTGRYNKRSYSEYTFKDYEENAYVFFAYKAKFCRKDEKYGDHDYLKRQASAEESKSTDRAYPECHQEFTYNGRNYLNTEFRYGSIYHISMSGYIMNPEDVFLGSSKFHQYKSYNY